MKGLKCPYCGNEEGFNIIKNGSSGSTKLRLLNVQSEMENSIIITA